MIADGHPATRPLGAAAAPRRAARRPPLRLGAVLLLCGGAGAAWAAGEDGGDEGYSGEDEEEELPYYRQELVYRANTVGYCGAGAEVWDSMGWRFLEFCGATRNAHFGAYHCEAMALPAAAALGPGLRRALVLGGADGCVATQLLKLSQLEQVVVVTADASLYEAAEYVPALSIGLKDERVQLIWEDPSAWLAGSTLDSSGSFNLVVVDEFRPSESLPREALLDLAQISARMAPGSLLVHYAATIWNLPRVQHLHQQFIELFRHVAVLQTSSMSQEPYHDIILVAGDLNPLEVEWDWWRQQAVPTIFYHEALHAALFVPAALLSRALGLRLPQRPDVGAAQQRDPSARPEPEAVNYQFTLPYQEGKRARDKRAWVGTDKSMVLLDKTTPFQNLEVLQREGFVSLYLDGELQLTDRFGDFYHESLVHPAMAALGTRGRRALVIGAGDGGVASVLLRYPVELVVQVEIDAEVVSAAKQFLPGAAWAFTDPRHRLIIGDAIAWVKAEEEAGGQYLGAFDLCVIDTTDDPLVSSWTRRFFHSLRRLLAPEHGTVVQNVGSQGDWLWEPEQVMRDVFARTHVISVNSPEYPSPYFLSLASDGLNPFEVDWTWWSGLKIETIYYHPTLHDQLFVLPRETQEFYSTKGGWDPVDAEWCQSSDMSTWSSSSSPRRRRVRGYSWDT